MCVREFCVAQLPTIDSLRVKRDGSPKNGSRREIHFIGEFCDFDSSSSHCKRLLPVKGVESSSKTAAIFQSLRHLNMDHEDLGNSSLLG